MANKAVPLTLLVMLVNVATGLPAYEFSDLSPSALQKTLLKQDKFPQKGIQGIYQQLLLKQQTPQLSQLQKDKSMQKLWPKIQESLPTSSQDVPVPYLPVINNVVTTANKAYYEQLPQEEQIPKFIETNPNTMLQTNEIPVVEELIGRSKQFQQFVPPMYFNRPILPSQDGGHSYVPELINPASESSHNSNTDVLKTKYSTNGQTEGVNAPKFNGRIFNSLIPASTSALFADNPTFFTQTSPTQSPEDKTSQNLVARNYASKIQNELSKSQASTLPGLIVEDSNAVDKGYIKNMPLIFTPEESIEDEKKVATSAEKFAITGSQFNLSTPANPTLTPLISPDPIATFPHMTLVESQFSNPKIMQLHAKEPSFISQKNFRKDQVVNTSQKLATDLSMSELKNDGSENSVQVQAPLGSLGVDKSVDENLPIQFNGAADSQTLGKPELNEGNSHFKYPKSMPINQPNNAQSDTTNIDNKSRKSSTDEMGPIFTTEYFISGLQNSSSNDQTAKLLPNSAGSFAPADDKNIKTDQSDYVKASEFYQRTPNSKSRDSTPFSSPHVPSFPIFYIPFSETPDSTPKTSQPVEDSHSRIQNYSSKAQTDITLQAPTTKDGGSGAQIDDSDNDRKTYLSQFLHSLASLLDTKSAKTHPVVGSNFSASDFEAEIPNSNSANEIIHIPAQFSNVTSSKYLPADESIKSDSNETQSSNLSPNTVAKGLFVGDKSMVAQYQMPSTAKTSKATDYSSFDSNKNQATVTSQGHAIEEPTSGIQEDSSKAETAASMDWPLIEEASSDIQHNSNENQAVNIPQDLAIEKSSFGIQNDSSKTKTVAKLEVVPSEESISDIQNDSSKSQTATAVEDQAVEDPSSGIQDDRGKTEATANLESLAVDEPSTGVQNDVGMAEIPSKLGGLAIEESNSGIQNSASNNHTATTTESQAIEEPRPVVQDENGLPSKEHAIDESSSGIEDDESNAKSATKLEELATEKSITENDSTKNQIDATETSTAMEGRAAEESVSNVQNESNKTENAIASRGVATEESSSGVQKHLNDDHTTGLSEALDQSGDQKDSSTLVSNVRNPKEVNESEVKAVTPISMNADYIFNDHLASYPIIYFPYPSHQFSSQKTVQVYPKVFQQR